MSTTKLDLVNRVLDSVGERRVTDTTGALALIAEDCIQLALDEVSTSANWNVTRQITVASSWTGTLASVSTSEVYKVTAVTTHNDSTSYPFKMQAKFVSMEEFQRIPKRPWTGANSGYVQYWTFWQGTGQIACTPYPNDDDSKAQVFFEYHTIPTVPSTDNETYIQPDRWMRMIELRASALFALKHQADDKLHTLYNREYMELKRKQLSNDTGFPSGGYTMYRGTRGRNVR
jgi:hypothetical protein